MALPSMIAPFVMAAALAAGAPASAPAPEGAAGLAHADAVKLRCAASFALAARWREAGDPRGAGLPALGPRGEEYFVRAVAQVMDSAGLDRDAVAERLRQLAAALAAPGALKAAMPSCLASLEASGL